MIGRSPKITTVKPSENWRKLPEKSCLVPCSQAKDPTCLSYSRNLALDSCFLVKEYIFIKSSSHCILLHPSNMLHSGPSIILQSTTFMILCKGQPLVLSRPQEPECNFTLLHADISFMGFFTLLACSRSCT